MEEIAENGLTEGFKLLAVIYKEVPRFRSTCHSFTRQLSFDLYKIYPEYSTLEFTPATTWCNYGFQQSYPEALLVDIEKPEEAKKFCTYMMSFLSESVPGANAECYRGIGRALPKIYSGYDETNQDITSFSLTSCNSLTDDVSNRDACINGVFSSLGNLAIQHEDGQSIDDKDPMKICEEQTDIELKNKCYSNYKYAALSLVATNTEKVFIESLPELENFFKDSEGSPAKDVVFTYGYNWAQDYFVVDEDINQAISACTSLPKEVVHFCVWGMSVGVAKSGLPNEQYQLMSRFCKAARAEFSSLIPQDCPAQQAIGYLHGIYSEKQFNEIIKYLETDLGEVVRLEDVSYYGF